ncbi:TcaA NTF2-like domain-containing protein [Actinopolymorpha pittospori]
MRGTRGFRAVAVGAVAIGLLLAGCGPDAPEPTVLDTPEASEPATSPSATPTTSPTPTPSVSTSPTSPGTIITGGSSDVDDATKTEVQAFVADYLEAQNKATENGDFSAVDDMVQDCGVCAASKQYVSGAYRAGGKVEGGIFTEPTITVGSQRSGRVTVTVNAVISAYKTTNGSGKVVDQGPAERQRYQYSVSKAQGGWRIVGGSVVQ